jgi:hypothetical protein
MAEGTLTREVTNNPLATSDLGNAPKPRRGLMGIQTGQGSVETDTVLQAGVDRLHAGVESLREKQRNEDFVRGQLAAASGETQEELRARGGSRHEMAGLVQVELGNAVTAWHQEQVQDARVNWSETAPEEYQAHLAKQSAELVASVGGDAFAQRTLTGMLTNSVSKLAQAQQIGHQKFVEDGIANEYGAGLGLSARNETMVVNATALGPRSNAGYQSYAESIVNNIIAIESGGKADAQNPNSTAGGLGQIIDSTWLSLLKKHRPDLVERYSKDELLALKKSNPALNKEMSIALTRDNASELAANGLEVNGRNSYLMHFAGNAGGKRVIRGDRDAHVSTVLTAGQIKANPFLKDWTVGEMQDWAARKMGQDVPNSIKQQVLTNPGLPPARHRAEVLGAMLDGIKNDDPSLFETAGGVATLRELGASNAEIRSMQNAYDQYKEREKSAYSMTYERGADEIIKLADDGNYSEEEIYERLQNFQDSHPRTDAEMKRLYEEVTQELRQNEKDQDGIGWNTPEGLAFIMDRTDDMRAATSNEEMQAVLTELVEEGNLRGIDAQMTAKQAVALTNAYDRAQEKRRAEIAKRSATTRKQLQNETDARMALTNGTLNDQSKDVQKAGFNIVKQEISNEVDADDSVPDHLKDAEKTTRLVSRLVQANAVDTELATNMAAAVVDVRGWDLNGDLPDEAVAAYATYLEFVRGEQATNAYMNRMFADKPEALDFFRTVQANEHGSADTTSAIRKAAMFTAEPETMEAAQRKVNEMNADGFMDDAVTEFTREAGLRGSWFQQWFGDAMVQADNNRDAAAVVEDPKLKSFINDATRTAVALIPGIDPKAAMKRAVGEAMNRGAPILGNFVVAPTGTDLYQIAGISKAEGGTAINEAVQGAIIDNFDTLPESAQESIMFALRGEAGNFMGAMLNTYATGEFRDRPAPGEISAESWRLETTNVEGDIIMRVYPTEATIDNWSKIFLGSGNEMDIAAMSQPIIFSLSEAGAVWNEKQNAETTTDSILNSFVDMFRSDAMMDTGTPLSITDDLLPPSN